MGMFKAVNELFAAFVLIVVLLVGLCVLGCDGGVDLDDVFDEGSLPVNVWLMLKVFIGFGLAVAALMYVVGRWGKK